MVGKVALISGACSMAGRHCANVLSAAGASLMLTDGDDAALLELSRFCRTQGVQAHSSMQDVSDESCWEALVSETVDCFGGLDILVSCGWADPVHDEGPLSVFERAHLRYQRKIDALFLGMKHAARAMQPDGAAGKGGAIVNLAMSMTQDVHTSTGMSAVDQTIREYTRLAAAEFGSLGYGIRANVIADGHLPRGMVSDEDMAERSLETALLFLASDDSSHMNGVEWPIDGPWFTKGRLASA